MIIELGRVSEETKGVPTMNEFEIGVGFNRRKIG
jgi:hypothetical protein